MVGRDTYTFVALWAHSESHSLYKTEYEKKANARLWLEMGFNCFVLGCGGESLIEG